MIEFNGKFDSRVNKKMTEYQLEKSKASIKKLMPLVLLLGALFVGLSFISFKSSGIDYFLFGVGVFLILFILIFPVTLKKTITKQQEMIERQSTLMGNLTEESFKFDDEKVFIFTTKGDKYRSAVETDYDYFCFVVEDDECYMMFISNVQCHVIFKDNLKQGTLEEFETLLSKHFVGDKYISKPSQTLASKK